MGSTFSGPKIVFERPGALVSEKTWTEADGVHVLLEYDEGTRVHIVALADGTVKIDSNRVWARNAEEGIAWVVRPGDP